VAARREAAPPYHASGMNDRGRPLYMIGVVAEMLKVHPQTLRFYEKKGLLRPSRTVGRTRMYSAEDVEELARLLRLTRDLGVNLAGVEIIIKMRRRMIDMQKQIEDLLAYVRDDGGEPKAHRPGDEPRAALVRAASGQLDPVDLF
jgi:MerR family transcriptional regulator/heat shock protein HspR